MLLLDRPSSCELECAMIGLECVSARHPLRPADGRAPGFAFYGPDNTLGDGIALASCGTVPAQERFGDQLSVQFCFCRRPAG